MDKSTDIKTTQLHRRTRSPHTRRTALMDAAEHLFLTKGLHETRIEDITAAAHVAKGTFYIYFHSRDSLLHALQQRFMTSFCVRIDTALAQCRPDDWQSQLRTWFTTAVDGLLDQMMVHDMLFQDIHPKQGRSLMSENPVIEQLCALLQQGAQANAWQVPAPDMMALMMFHAMHGLVDDALARGEIDHRSSLVSILTETFSKALGQSA
ncbi:TetR/AcrR family transcriptional regulator [Vibrio gazogenes]|uniref:Transcriptional regulator, TetR family n=1 Tax=Vibrio gazogenes DSM 21264 = NBRC 103151 TaxID=1123492 RepID=A0A1M5HEG3_VIBGA|nr:TetR/AcrR family transcriptional regulator [Vibrio gazogenes]USP13604.1 TetR/AcrR family transcriptional regulator [Vibrio gazogenes]SHG14346.1 transcriptional regulator, TetR family [Vibrio gazogenes DSM 21264] [Vibrio gazogenes DSM 21264 = NBRC 103151]SJN55639.1 DNA-binding transcriptional regulator EnvR [Vibrio gazogenes]